MADENQIAEPVAASIAPEVAPEASASKVAAKSRTTKLAPNQTLLDSGSVYTAN